MNFDEISLPLIPPIYDVIVGPIEIAIDSDFLKSSKLFCPETLRTAAMSRERGRSGLL